MAAGSIYLMRDGSATQVASGIKTDVDGAFSFVVHEGSSYVVTASFMISLRTFG